MKVIRVTLDRKNLNLLDPSSDYRDQLSPVVIRARKWAEERNIKFQKRIKIGGDCKGNCYLVYGSHAVRDLLIESLKESNITIVENF